MQASGLPHTAMSLTSVQLENGMWVQMHSEAADRLLVDVVEPRQHSNREWWPWCKLCWKWADEWHVKSDLHICRLTAHMASTPVWVPDDAATARPSTFLVAPAPGLPPAPQGPPPAPPGLPPALQRVVDQMQETQQRVVDQMREAHQRVVDQMQEAQQRVVDQMQDRMNLFEDKLSDQQGVMDQLRRSMDVMEAMLKNSSGWWEDREPSYEALDASDSKFSGVPGA